MIIRDIRTLDKTGFIVDWGNGLSHRFLTERDGMGYTLTETHINPGSSSVLEYKRHLEACYCVEGEGEVEDAKTGEVHPIAPGTMYALDKHDKHTLRAKSRMRLVCVFNPPLQGPESHALKTDQSSSY
jgi:L-ectoine synthase